MFEKTFFPVSLSTPQVSSSDGTLNKKSFWLLGFTSPSQSGVLAVERYLSNSGDKCQ